MKNSTSIWGRIAARLEVFNDRLEAQVRKQQVFLDNMKTEEMMEENKKFLRAYFRIK